MHRYLPALVGRDGWRTLHVDVAHAARHAGRSNYANLTRAVVGVYDLVGVMWLIRRRKKATGVERSAETRGRPDLGGRSSASSASTTGASSGG